MLCLWLQLYTASVGLLLQSELVTGSSVLRVSYVKNFCNSTNNCFSLDWRPANLQLDDSVCPSMSTFDVKEVADHICE